MLPPAQPLSHHATPLADITVHDFFNHINWTGVEQLPPPEPSVETEAPYKTVGQFFATFPWQGQGNVPDQPIPPAPQPGSVAVENFTAGDEDDLTLDDFSALF